MTSGADDKGFASASGHERGPRGLGWVPWAEFGEITDVMDFHLSDLFAEFAPSLEEPTDQFLARVVLAVGLAVVDDRCLLPFEGDARAFTREEVQRFIDYADDQVERAVRAKRKGALTAYRDATLFKVIYGWGLFSGARPCVGA